MIKTLWIASALLTAACLPASANARPEVRVLGLSPAVSTCSPDGSALLAPFPGSLSTTDGNWTFGMMEPANQPYAIGQYQIFLNGQSTVNVPTGYGALMFVNNDCHMYYFNSYKGQWYAWEGSIWAASAFPY